MRTAVVTGAGGFVGAHLVRELARRGLAVRALLRSASAAQSVPSGVSVHVTGDLAAEHGMDELLRGADSVFHLAARAHVLSDAGGKNADAYRINNEVVTSRLANTAARLGVRRFVFVSTIKVYGEKDRGRPFTIADEPQPQDPYGASKLQAEKCLWDACRASGMVGVVVRPPLIYGPGVRANFLRLMRYIDRGVPLPFAAVSNKRSMVSAANLIDLLCRCEADDAAAGGTFLVSDGRDLSTPELVRELAAALGRRARLLWAPTAALRLVGRLTGHSDEVDRLTESLSLDISDTRRRLRWSPPVAVEEGIRGTVAAYRQAAGQA